MAEREKCLRIILQRLSAAVKPEDMNIRGKKQAGKTRIMIPSPSPKSSLSNYEKAKQRKRFRKRAGIEGVIGHLKADHRLGRNFLS